MDPWDFRQQVMLGGGNAPILGPFDPATGQQSAAATSPEDFRQQVSMGGGYAPILGNFDPTRQQTAASIPSTSSTFSSSYPTTMAAPAASATSYRYSPSTSTGKRNRYAEIMAQFGQSQPFSFFGMPSGGFNPYAPDYTGGFTPYKRLVTPQPIVNPIQPTVPMVGGAGGGGGYANSPEGRAARESYFDNMTDEQRAAHLATNEAIGEFIDKGARVITPGGLLESLFGSEESTGGPSRMQSPAAAIAKSTEEHAIQAANSEAYKTYAPPQDPAQMKEALGRYVRISPVDQFAPGYVAPVVAPVPAPAPPAPVAPPQQMMTVTERFQPTESDNIPPGGTEGWSKVAIGKGEYAYTRPVSVAVDRFTDSEGNFDFSALRRAGLSISGIGGGQGSSGGGYTVGGYAPGSQAASAAASGTVGGYGPGTPGFNGGMSGFAQGGHVSMMHLQGPNPMGPDDGYGALKDGEYVINDKAVKKYGIELMNAINSGKISKGKLRGLLEM